MLCLIISFHSLIDNDSLNTKNVFFFAHSNRTDDLHEETMAFVFSDDVPAVVMVLDYYHVT